MKAKQTVTVQRAVLLVGATLVLAFVGYSLYAAAGALAGDSNRANVFAALGMLGLVLVLAATLLRVRKPKLLRRTLVGGGFALVASFLAYSIYLSAAAVADDPSAANAFALAGMCGMTLLLAATALQRAR